MMVSHAGVEITSCSGHTADTTVAHGQEHPALDIDLTEEIIEHPERFPLWAK